MSISLTTLLCLIKKQTASQAALSQFLRSTITKKNNLRPRAICNIINLVCIDKIVIKF